VELSPDGVRTLIRQLSHLFVAEFLVGDEQQEQAVFRGEGIEGTLDPFAQLLGLQLMEGIGSLGIDTIEDPIVLRSLDLPRRPRLSQVGTVVEGDPIEPGPHGGGASESPKVPERLQEDVMGDILGLDRVTREAEGKVMADPWMQTALSPPAWR
jgi:hypothetical protein